MPGQYCPKHTAYGLSMSGHLVHGIPVPLKLCVAAAPVLNSVFAVSRLAILDKNVVPAPDNVELNAKKYNEGLESVKKHHPDYVQKFLPALDVITEKVKKRVASFSNAVCP